MRCAIVLSLIEGGVRFPRERREGRTPGEENAGREDGGVAYDARVDGGGEYRVDGYVHLERFRTLNIQIMSLERASNLNFMGKL